MSRMYVNSPYGLILDEFSFYITFSHYLPTACIRILYRLKSLLIELLIIIYFYAANASLKLQCTTYHILHKIYILQYITRYICNF